MLDDPMFTAELIAEKRDAEDAKWRAQMEDLKAREAYHEAAGDRVPHGGAFADCTSPTCRGEVPVTR